MKLTALSIFATLAATSVAVPHVTVTATATAPATSMVTEVVSVIQTIKCHVTPKSPRGVSTASGPVIMTTLPAEAGVTAHHHRKSSATTTYPTNSAATLTSVSTGSSSTIPPYNASYVSNMIQSIWSEATRRPTSTPKTTDGARDLTQIHAIDIPLNSTGPAAPIFQIAIPTPIHTPYGQPPMPFPPGHPIPDPIHHPRTITNELIPIPCVNSEACNRTAAPPYPVPEQNQSSLYTLTATPSDLRSPIMTSQPQNATKPGIHHTHTGNMSMHYTPSQSSP
ncbi:hypothetical protein MMC28_007332 [Mycoblastus sanguinarius]|nr:hypothetical protein [Mycoblastus sanguinarius]